MNVNRPKMAPVIRKATVTKIVKITSKNWGNALKIKLIIQQALTESYKPITPEAHSFSWRGTQAGCWPSSVPAALSAEMGRPSKHRIRERPAGYKSQKLAGE